MKENEDVYIAVV